MLNHEDIRLLEAISESQRDMELSESSDQYMRDLRQLIKREIAKSTEHRYRPAYQSGSMLLLPLHYCLICELAKDAVVKGQPVHVAYTRVVLDSSGMLVEIVPPDATKKPKLQRGWRVDEVPDLILGALANGEAVLPKGSLLQYTDGMVSTVNVNDSNEE